MEGVKAEILVVDDEEKNLQVLAGHLHRAGYDVVFASNGEEAIKALDPVLPDLVLLDVMMPGLDGYQVCEIIRRRFKSDALPILFLTARTAQEDVVKGFDVGAQDYILKPLKIPELLARVKTHLDLKLARSQLAASNKSLQELNMQQKRTFSILSHDLRGSISGVSNLLQELSYAMEEDFQREDFTELVGHANENMTHLTDLMNDVLKWSRSQMNMLKYDPQKIIISDCINALFSQYAKASDDKGIDLVSKIESDMMIEADLDIVTTVLRNLLSNAIKFTKPGGQVTVSAQVHGADAHVTVEDNGVGMEQDLIDRIKAQEGVESALGTNQERGTGLGLSLCLSLIQHHGGSMEIEPAATGGTRISFMLPSAEV